MKRKKRYEFLVLILVLAIGFAAVSTNLIINGNSLFGTNEDDFKIVFTKSVIDGIDVSESTISEDGASLTFTTSELAIMNDTSVLDFEVTNNSTQYDASVQVECVAEGEKANTYYKVESELPEVINAASKENGNVTVTLLKTSVDEIEETFTCTINATATERNTVGEVVPVGPFYAFGLPTTASTTDYTTLNSKVFVKLDNDSLLSVCINDGELFCMVNNDYENSVISMKNHFGESNCNTNDSYTSCVLDNIVCDYNFNGDVACHDYDVDSYCLLDSKNSVDCA